MKVVIAKVDEVYFDGVADSLTAPGTEGQLTVMAHHMPLVTTLKAGNVTIRGEQIPGGLQTFEVSGGILEVNQGGATILL